MAKKLTEFNSSTGANAAQERSVASQKLVTPANRSTGDVETFPDEAEYQARENGTAPATASEAGAGYPVTLAEIAYGIVAVSSWLLFFVCGTVIGTADHRQLLDAGESGGLLATLWSLFTVLTCYTITNVAFLACLAAIAGEFSSRSRQSSLASAASRSAESPQLREVLACYSAAAMRGFVIYLLFIAGLLLVTTEAIASADQGQYVRLAGTVSVLSFVAGYDTEMFRRALDRVVSLVSQTQVSHRSKSS